MTDASLGPDRLRPAVTGPAHGSVLLRVQGLRVRYETRSGPVEVVRGVEFCLSRGETLCIVGESGSGKTTLALALVGLLPANARIAGEVVMDGDLLSAYDEDRLADVRGRRVGIIFQDPARALNPVLPVGLQIAEVLERHTRCGRAAARRRATALLDEVGVSDATLRLGQYPHELSGGLKQRVMIAIAVACQPELLIADEPTTALDVTVQRQVLGLMRRLARDRGLSIIFVTHDFGVVAAMADSVAVMYAGRIVEYAPVAELFAAPLHPYTSALQRTNPRAVLEARYRAEVARLAPIRGAPPNPRELPGGCEFSPRCPHSRAECMRPPPLSGAGHAAACWFPGIAG